MSRKGKYVYEWPRPMVSVDAAVFNVSKKGVKILLIKRGKEPFKDKWALPGGFVGMDEELEDAAGRELDEETGLSGIKLEQMHTFGTVGRDPRGRQITIVFMAITAGNEKKPRPGDDAAKARWFNIEKLPAEVAFDHDKVIRLAIRKLKSRKIYRLCRREK